MTYLAGAIPVAPTAATLRRVFVVAAIAPSVADFSLRQSLDGNAPRLVAKHVNRLDIPQRRLKLSYAI